jgi:hypothetical protein
MVALEGNDLIPVTLGRGLTRRIQNPKYICAHIGLEGSRPRSLDSAGKGELKNYACRHSSASLPALAALF